MWDMSCSCQVTTLARNDSFCENLLIQTVLYIIMIVAKSFWDRAGHFLPPSVPLEKGKESSYLFSRQFRAAASFLGRKGHVEQLPTFLGSSLWHTYSAKGD